LHTEMYTPARLEKGDSIYFDSQMGHAYIAVGDRPCRILSICAPSESVPHDPHGNIAEPVPRGKAAPQIVDGSKPAKHTGQRGRTKSAKG
jgi:hypothetical protein